MFTYDWNFGRVAHYAGAFFNGLGVTIELSAATILFATCLGIAWGVGLARNVEIRIVTQPLLDVLRSLPPLVLVLFGYFFYVKNVVGISIPAFWAFVFSVGFNVAAFIADLTRASIQNTPGEYIEVANALGLSERQILRRVIAPVALRELLPPLSYIYIETIKLTSLASVVSVQETVYVAQDVITSTSRSLETWAIVAAIYCVLILPATFVARKLELRMKRSVGLIKQ